MGITFVPVLAAARVTTILMAIIVVVVSLQLGRELAESDRIVFFVVVAAGHVASALLGDVKSVHGTKLLEWELHWQGSWYGM